MKVGIINYGMGNLYSVKKAVEDLNFNALILNDPKSITSVQKLILPGVGSFYEGMVNLTTRGWVDSIISAVKDNKISLLGICLGMQMLSDYGYEGGGCKGLSLISGKVVRLNTLGCEKRIPHVGWNEISFSRNHFLFEDIPDSSDFYFVHSYAFNPSNQSDILAECNYGINFTACITNGSTYGTQFHPEKSSKVGRRLLLNFLNNS